MNLRLPSITGATVGERLEQVVRYLFSLVNDLNFALGQTESGKTTTETAGTQAVTDGAAGAMDYRKLSNKPTLNGTELVGNVDETDPTVPAWAKSPVKPTYTAAEVGAVTQAVFSFTIPASAWSGSDGWFVASRVTVSGILSTDNCIVDLQKVWQKRDTAVSQSWAYVDSLYNGDGYVDVYATAKPTVDLPVTILVIRA